MRLKVLIVKPGLWGLTKKDIRDAGREGIMAAGMFWHEHYKKHHFQIYAFNKYGYSRRSSAYGIRKHREHPEAGDRPLVFTGDSERSAMAGNKVMATAASWERFHADVIVNAPTLNYHRLYDELTRTTPSEVRMLSSEFSNVFTRAFLRTAQSRQGTIELAAFQVA